MRGDLCPVHCFTHLNLCKACIENSFGHINTVNHVYNYKYWNMFARNINILLPQMDIHIILF